MLLFLCLDVLPPPSYEDVTKEQPPTERQAIQK